MYRIRWGRLVLSCTVFGVLCVALRGCAMARNKPKAEVQTVTAMQVRVMPAVALSVYDQTQKLVLPMELEHYLAGVVAAEMPVSFSTEALKAQAVAARTYTVYHLLHGGCAKSGSDICTASACCQAYADDDRLREKWGEAYAVNIARIGAAVNETAGEILLYDGAPIDALYHSASGGATENAESAFAMALPYLVSVPSENETGTSRLFGEVRFSATDFCKRVNNAYPNAGLIEKRLEQQVEIKKTSDSGRVLQLRLGKTTITGKQLRKLIALDSTMFTMEFDGADVVFHTRGYGHGVGMSQTGANAMALGGRSYREILLYYYTGVSFGAIRSIAS